MIETRAGTGYDVHAFIAGRELVLGGVRIPHTHGLDGHSDADVLTHALIDALFGAAGLGDIGDWFPSSDPRFRDVGSLTLLDRVVVEIARAGWRVVNVDGTIVAQEPRLAGRRAEMRQRLAERLGVELGRVSIKATTPDHLGALGRSEGIAAHVVVLLQAATPPEGVSDS